MTAADPTTPRVAPNFITEVIERDLNEGHVQKVVTRFPPEPNGYLHLGHTYASTLDFQVALDYGGHYHLRLDDTNPEGESEEFALGIQADLKWLGWDWEALFYASDYFETYYQYAVKLIEKGAAYVDSVTGAEMARLRGTATTPGTPSPYRERSVAENLDLFARMRAGEFPDGAHVLRAKIDLASPNMKLRDPVLYRILRAHHYRQGDAWCIYPLYDFQHPLQDAIEGVTHSLCSLEFVDNRAIYDWLMETLGFRPRPHQYEFGRRSLEYTVVSKRKLRRLVHEGHVAGWDDPRMPTLVAQRRRGVTPEAIRTFARNIGVNRTNRTVDISVLEHAIRDDLNTRAPRVMAVLRPIRVVLTNLEAPVTVRLPYWPPDVVKESADGLVALPGGERVAPEQATRDLQLTREIYIEADDFATEPPKGFKRLTPGGTVRLRGAGVIRAGHVETDDEGRVTVIHAELLGEDARAPGVIHWVSAEHAMPAEFRLYDRLFTVPHPEAEAKELEDEEGGEEGTEERDFLSFVNPESLTVTRGFVEAGVAAHPQDTRYQFERQGYFWQDPKDSREGALVFGRIITLKDTWGRAEAAGAEPARKARPEKPSEVPQAAPTLTAEQAQQAARLEAQGVSANDAAVIVRDELLADYLAQAAQHGEVAALAPWVVNDLGGALKSGANRVTPEGLAALVALLARGEISARIAKDALAQAQASGEAPADIVAGQGLRVIADRGQLEAVVDVVLSENAAKVADYRAGRKGLMGFFTGQVMKTTGGLADPKLVAELLNEKLG